MEFNRRWGIAETVKRAGWPQTRPNDFVYCTSMVGLGADARPHPALCRQNAPPFTPEPALRLRADLLRPDPLASAALAAFGDDAPSDQPRLLRRRMRDGVRATITDRKTGKSEIIEARISRRLRRRRRRGRRPSSARLRGRRRLRQEHQHLFPLTRADGDPRQGLGALLPLHRCRRHLGRDHRHRRQGDLAAFGAEGRLDGYDTPDYMRRLARPRFHLRGDLGHALGAARARRDPLSRRQRVFIAGDAAHQNSPTGGLGLHTGLADARRYRLEAHCGAARLGRSSAARELRDRAQAGRAQQCAAPAPANSISLPPCPAGPRSTKRRRKAKRCASAGPRCSTRRTTPICRCSPRICASAIATILADRRQRRQPGDPGRDQAIRALGSARHARAACLAPTRFKRGRPLDPRSLRQRLRAAAPRRCAAVRYRHRRSRRDARCAADRRRSRRSRRSPRFTSAASCWCGPTATSPGATTRRLPTR